MADINVAQFSSVPGARIVGRRTSQPISGVPVPLESVQGQAYLSGAAYPTYASAAPVSYGAYPATSFAGAFRPSVTYAGAAAPLSYAPATYGAYAPATYGAYGAAPAAYGAYPGVYGARYGAYAPRPYGYYDEAPVRARRSRRSRRSRSTRRPRSRRSRRL